MFNVNLKKVFNSDKIVIEECELEPSNLIDHIPNLDKNYVFELNVLNEVLLYLIYPLKTVCILVVRQVAVRQP